MLTPSQPSITTGSARSVLLTLLGEFVFPHYRAISTTALLHAFASVNITERTARQALSRSAASGWITATKEGRRTSWALTPAGHNLIARGSQRVQAISKPNPHWDEHWLILHITLPEQQRLQRIKLYRTLGWLGFGNPTPGLWLCPYTQREDDLRKALHNLGLDNFSLAFAGRHLALGLSNIELVQRAWNLSDIAAHYQNLTKRFSEEQHPAEANSLGEHILLVNALQRLPAIDPGLPPALLPNNWPGKPAIAHLEQHRAKLARKAHTEWKALEAAYPG